MICVMIRGATRQQVSHVVSVLDKEGIPHTRAGQGSQTFLQIDSGDLNVADALGSLPGVHRIIAGTAPFRFVERRFQLESTVVKVGRASIGNGGFAVAAGPCAVESREQLLTSARAVQEAGATILRGDAYKPRTSPYAFQGLGPVALEYLSEARSLTGLPFMAEVVDPRDIEVVTDAADMIRIGTRNMSNYALLKEVGRQQKPVVLKRGRTATIEEWLDAAEYVYDQGNHDIVLVERGIRSFDQSARNTLDISAIPIVKALSHLPVMVDPSHAAGRRDLVAPLSKAAIAAGADGVLIDVHPRPDLALVDGDQALLPAEFATLMQELAEIGHAVGTDI